MTVVTRASTRATPALALRRQPPFRVILLAAAVLTAVCSALLVSVFFPWSQPSPGMLASGMAGGYSAPFAAAGEGIAFGFPLTSSRGPYRVRITGVQLLAQGTAPLPRLLGAGLTPASALATPSSCDVLLGCSQFEGAWQYWPPREILGPRGTVVHIPIMSFDRSIVIGNVRTARSWSLALNVLGPRPDTTYKFQVAITVIWRGQTSVQVLPMDGWVPTGPGYCRGSVHSPASSCS